MTCAIEGCERPVHNRRGWCRMHYFRWYRTGNAGEATPRQRPSRLARCMIEGCTKPDKAAGYCSMHAARLRRHGDVHTVIPVTERKLPTGPAHHNWAGNNITYSGAHARVFWSKGNAAAYHCIDCGKQAEHWAYDNTDPAELFDDRGYRYSATPEHYQPMCVRCHKRFDSITRGDAPNVAGQDSVGTEACGRTMHIRRCSRRINCSSPCRQADYRRRRALSTQALTQGRVLYRDDLYWLTRTGWTGV